MQVISGMRELGLASLGLDHLYIHCDSQHHANIFSFHLSRLCHDGLLLSA